MNDIFSEKAFVLINSRRLAYAAGLSVWTDDLVS